MALFFCVCTTLVQTYYRVTQFWPALAYSPVVYTSMPYDTEKPRYGLEIKRCGHYVICHAPGNTPHRYDSRKSGTPLFGRPLHVFTQINALSV